MSATDVMIPRTAAASDNQTVTGEFTQVDGERYYLIRNVDQMPPFFISVVSSDDHWLFVSSTGGLTAGRVSPDTPLFPYITVDRIHESTHHTGCVTYVHVRSGGEVHEWQPFGDTLDSQWYCTRNLYKSALGDKLRFEEINHDLGLAFRYTWCTSSEYGFVRQVTLENLTDTAQQIDILDGFRNLLPAGTPRFTQTNSSNLVDAYKWTEYDQVLGLGLLTLYSGITDRAEPCESLHANVVYCLGLDQAEFAISENPIAPFRRGQGFAPESLRRGVRGAFLVNASLQLAAHGGKSWRLVANTELTQSEVIALGESRADSASLDAAITASIAAGSDRLARIMAAADGFQATAEPIVAAHHYSNVLFNVLRGGIFADQYQVWAGDLRATIAGFNKPVSEHQETFLDALPPALPASDLLQRVSATGDKQLLRLVREYLPITFGRRHGDPSRPWNQFAINLRDAAGNPRLSYEGNWRDIFQNWEALAFSYPEFIESVIAKFVNASTVDGYNPYRITKEGIDWEVEEPDDPWSYIGYWGDHQIIYLQKLLELSRQYHPDQLTSLLFEPIFSYANVPYRVRPFAALVANPKETVDFDDDLATRIDERVATIGADGKLVLGAEGKVYQVTLIEKLIVPLLGKLGNLVVDGGIWLNTQRPEWNDANNALVGQGLSMVTLYYLRRYVCFLQDLVADQAAEVSVSAEVATWHRETAAALAALQPQLLDGQPLSPAARLAALKALGEPASRFRETVYAAEGFSGTESLRLDDIRTLLADALATIEHTIASNCGDDGLYHAYNLMHVSGDALHVERLYPMLEGQVAALSAGALSPAAAADVLESLFASPVYRPDQNSFMLYPDRDLPGYLDKNRVPDASVAAIPALAEAVAAGDHRLIERDPQGQYRFNAYLTNAGKLDDVLASLSDEDETLATAISEPVRALYEEVFAHRAFTGRSGTMFGFEGLGCIYWHMVAKLLLAVQENVLEAADSNADATTRQRLGELYYRVRGGIGFNKTPTEFGAFPADPYSHTPGHAGARQPGMTGQVKEEVLTRFGELGIRVHGGRVRFAPMLLRAREFQDDTATLRYLDTDNQWQDVTVGENALAFTWCQVPVVYTLADTAGIVLIKADGSATEIADNELSGADSQSLFERSGQIRRINVAIARDSLFEH
ncbi:MAG: hypothetical protein AAGF46_00070 [Pseudomonadota bacterium]